MVVRSMDELNLHDSDLQRIVIPRQGEPNDTVEVYLSYIEVYAHPWTTSDSVLRFRKVWQLWLDMPSSGGTAIRGGSTTLADARIDALREQWRTFWREPRDLVLHTIELDAGTLTVICESASLERV